MSYTVVVREVATGRELPYLMEDIEWGEGSEFWWSEGNFGCDCNRRMTFHRADGVPEEIVENDDGPCGQGAFVVVEITLTDGTRVYSEIGLPVYDGDSVNATGDF